MGLALTRSETFIETGAAMSWRVATSLDVLLDEINRAAPNRSKVSDGSIGDAAHASRASDHNPWRPGSTVGARDFTHDPGDLDCNKLAEFLTAKIRAGTHPALGSGAYVIWNYRIFSRDRASEGWRSYTGNNPHNHHLHLSVCTAQSGFDSRQPWGWGGDEEQMPYSEKQVEEMAYKGAMRALQDAKFDVGREGKWSLSTILKTLLPKGSK